jgi:hypothetical protein
MFGPAFAVYVSQPPPARDGVNTLEVRTAELKRALERWPDSVWADSIAYALGKQYEERDYQAAAEAYFTIPDAYPESPFAPRALARVTRAEPESIPAEVRLRAARRLLSQYPQTPEMDRGAQTLREHYPGEVTPEELLSAALAAAEAGPRYRRPVWLITAAEVHRDRNEPAEAKRLAAQARDSAVGLLAEYERARDEATDIYPHLATLARVRDAAAAMANGAAE